MEKESKSDQKDAKRGKTKACKSNEEDVKNEKSSMNQRLKKMKVRRKNLASKERQH
uniref:Uncharacterized protein n=1 Tax=Cucumis melo TaxID=3656 RepID=A0A9I9D3Q5_CUCME